MKLDAASAGPYLRALNTALRTAAPHRDFVPLAEAEATLTALDPAVSGALFAPAEVDQASGLPSFTWISRARAELAASPSSPSQVRIDAVRAADPELAARLDARSRLRNALRNRAVLPASRLQSTLRAREPDLEVGLTFDRLGIDGLWTRLSIVLALPKHRGLDPAVAVEGDEVVLHPGLLHVLERHAPVALCALRAHLTKICVADVRRLSRARIGPFWFPGIDLPDDVPAALASGLVLHLHRELVADDVRSPVHADPWCSPPSERIPGGYGVVRERRFAASRELVPVLQAWAAAADVPALITPLPRP